MATNEQAVAAAAIAVAAAEAIPAALQAVVDGRDLVNAKAVAVEEDRVAVEAVAADMASIESALALLKKPTVQVAGRPMGTTLTAGSTATSSQTVVFQTPFDHDGIVDTLDAWIAASGTIYYGLLRDADDDGVYETTVGTGSVAVTVAGGGSEQIGIALTPITHKAGDILQYRASASGVLRHASSNIDNVRVPGPSTLLTSFTPGAANNVTPQLRFRSTWQDQVITADALDGLAPKSGPASSNLPACTDGRGMSAWRGKLANLAKSVAARSGGLFMGDSWAEYYRLPQALADRLYARAGKAGDGFISVSALTSGNGKALNSIGMTRSASWVGYDASNGSAPATACGPDGQAISTTATDQTVQITNLTCTTFKIFYWNTTGTFRYRIDGGAWTAVTGDGSDTKGVVNRTGLSNTAHTIDIDTTGNAGTVLLCGYYATVASANGVEFSKMGNAAITGAQQALFAATFIAPWVAEFATPDFAVIALGTNDYKNAGNTPATYREGVEAMIAAVRSVNPRCAVILIAPADTNGTPVLPLTDYRDEAYAIAIEHGCEFWNMHDEWGTWAQENAAGQWADDFHVNDVGGYRAALAIDNRFFGV